MTVFGKATRMMHIIPCNKTLTEQQAGQYYFGSVAKLHSVLKLIYTNRRTQFISKLWKELWGLFGTGLRPSTAFHPQTQGIVEIINAVIERMICCTLGAINEN